MSFIESINRYSFTSLQSISRFHLFTALVFPFFLLHSVILSAQTIDAPPSNTKELLQTTTDKTYIIIDDDKQLGDLLKRIENPDFQLIRPPSPIIAEPGTSPVTSKIQSLSFLGNMTGSVIQFQLQIQSEQLAQGDVWTDIGLNGILLQSVTENGLPLMASPTPQGNWMVKTQKPGLHNLNILFAVNIGFDRSSRRISCQIPEANNISLELRIPEKVLFASTGRNETLGLTYDRSKNEFLVKGKLPNRNRMDIRWLGQSLISGQPFQKMECRGMIGLNIDRDAITTRQQWLINRIEYLPEKIKFSLPSNVSLNDVTLNGKATRPEFQTNADNTTSITIPVSFSDEIISTDLITLEITTRERYNQSENDDEMQILWSTPRWEEIQTISGVIALEYPDGYNLITSGSSHFNMIDPRILPDKIRKSSISGAIEFHGDLEKIPLKLMRRKANLLIESQTIGIASAKRVEYVSEFAIEGQPETSGVYEFHLPDHCQVLFIGPTDIVQSYQITPKNSNESRDYYQINLNPVNDTQERNRIRIRYIQEINDEKSGLFAVPQFRNAIVRRNQALLLPESRSLKLVSDSKVINQLNTNSSDYLELMPLLNRSFDELELIGRLQPESSNPAIYTRATDKESINFSFQILTSKPEISFRIEHEFQPDLNNPIIQTKYLFEKPDELPDVLKFKISPTIVNRIHKVTTNYSGFQNAIKYSIDEQNIEIETEHSDERPYIIRFEINAEGWFIKNDSIPGILRMFTKLDPEMIVLDQGRCEETILIQKASDQFIPAFSSDQSSWQLMSRKSDEVASSDPTLKWKLRDPNFQIPELSWIRVHDSDKEQTRNILNDIHVVYDLSEYKKHSTIYHINQGIAQIEIEKPANQALISAEIPQKELIIYEKPKSYIIKWETTSRHFMLKTDWVHLDSNIKKIQVAYPLSPEFDQQSTRTTISLVPRSGFYSFFLPLRYNLWKVSNNDLNISTDENHKDSITNIVQHSVNLNTFTKIGPIKIIELPTLLFFTVFIFLVSIILAGLWTFVNPKEFLFIIINVFILTLVLTAMNILPFTYSLLIVLSIPVTILMVFTQKLIFRPKQTNSLNDENNQIIASQTDIVALDSPMQAEDSTVIRFNPNQKKTNESTFPSETRLVQPQNKVTAGWNLSLDVNDNTELSE